MLEPADQQPAPSLDGPVVEVELEGTGGLVAVGERLELASMYAGGHQSGCELAWERTEPARVVFSFFFLADEAQRGELVVTRERDGRFVLRVSPQARTTRPGDAAGRTRLLGAAERAMARRATNRLLANVGRGPARGTPTS